MSHRESGARARRAKRSGSVLESRPMRRDPFFFAYFWFSPPTGGWTNVRT
jgi:hypothetical protein